MVSSESRDAAGTAARFLKLTIGAVFLVGLLNSAFLSQASPPPGAVSATQYQSFIFSVSSAVNYDQTGDLLIVPRGNNDRRLEDITADDLGYPLLLSGLTRLGIVDFSVETEDFVTQGWSIEASREFMRTTLRDEVGWLNRTAFAATSTIAALTLLCWALRRFRRSQHMDVGLTSLALGLFIVGQLLPHLSPAFFVGRLHQHGLIATLSLTGLIAMLITGWALERLRWRALTVRSVLGAGAATFAAGLIVGLIALIRRSEGVAWIGTAAIVFALWILIHRSVRRKQLVAILIGVAMLVGWSLPALALDRIVDDRDNNELQITGEKAISAHPIYHAFLIGISSSPKNNLGISNEPDVVALVQAETGFEGDAFTPGYEEASSHVYWNYVKSSPGNYAAVLIDNVDKKLNETLSHYGIRATGFSWLYVLGALTLWITFMVRIAWQSGGSLQIAAVALPIHLVSTSAIAIATTFPGTYGPAADLAMLVAIGIGGLINRNASNLRTLAGALGMALRSTIRAVLHSARPVDL